MLLQADVDIVKDLGLWRWLIYFLVISLVPVVNNFFSVYIKSKREAKLEKIIKELGRMPLVLEDVRGLLYERYTECISLNMAESLIRLMTDASVRLLMDVCDNIIANNDLKESRVAIKKDLTITMDNLWAQNESLLSKFKYNNIRISEAINDEWKEEIQHIIFEGLFESGNMTKRNIKRLHDNIRTEFENMRFNTLSILQKI